MWPLLQVCDNFRVIAFPLYYYDYRLHLYVCADKIEIENCSWTKHIDCLDYPLPTLAREIQIRIHMRDIYEGHALQRLSTKPYNGRAFPQVRELRFNLATEGKWNEDNDYDTPDADSNILAFVGRIKEMTPQVSEVHLSIMDPDSELATGIGKRTRLLLSSLPKLTETILLKVGWYTLAECLDIAPLCMLGHLKFELKDDASLVSQLAWLNSQTLQTMDIYSAQMVDVSGLIRKDTSGDYVEYPCLYSLTMGVDNTSVVLQQSVFEGATPFPSLVHLCLNSGYPFGDDLVFRGNVTTLEYVKLDLTAELVMLLIKHNVFTRTSHPNLQCVNTALPLSRSPAPFAVVAAYMQFAMSIAPKAPVRVIDDLLEFDHILPSVLLTLKDYASIQVLSLPRVYLSFWEAVSLIKSLPILLDLHTLAPILGEIPLGLTEVDLPDYVQSIYAPMGKRFRCWHITKYLEYDDAEIVTFMLLLALVCPNFDYAAVDESYREPFMKEMRSQIAEPRFSRHAPRLRRLLFDGWQG
ncbi:hypothetical protein IW146_008009 [Coemansia sp. RSA 922]|nr:hypothetical protein IW146_008009 [Coemansia sp. RSA 922]